MIPKYERLLPTGAAGLLGQVLRPAMRTWAKHLRVSDIAPIRDSWWDNSKAANLEWTPKDNTEPFRAKKEAEPPVDPAKPENMYQGGVSEA